MKKKPEALGKLYPFAKKMMLIMRLTIFLVLVSVLASTASVYSQTTKLTVKVKNSRIAEVFDAIEQQSDFYFFYNRDLFDDNQIVSVDMEGKTVEEILNELFDSKSVTYEVVDSNILIKTVEEKVRESNTTAPQEKPVSGKISDKSGEPLPGVTVVVKGTTNGTITDFDGNYTITNVPAGATLQYSFVGMRAQEIVVGDQSVINITMEEETIGLEEVVAVGYGTQSKRVVTGSIQSVDSEELSDMPVTTTAQKLQGKLSGVQISQTSGAPGEGMKVRVRGQASLTAGSDPLYVVDGFPINGDISFLNPNEIESISVLKDASSAALYGSRAANGVVLVTTKHGKPGKTSVSLAANFGFQQVPDEGRPDMMNATEFATFKKESLEDLGLAVPEVWQNPSKYGAGTDFYDELLRVAPMQDYSLSFSGSGENSSTTAVIGYLNQDGVIKNSEYVRYSLRINSDFKIGEKVKTGFSVAPTYINQSGPNTDGINWGEGLLANALSTWPIFDPYDNEGNMVPNFFEPTTGTRMSNPLWEVEQRIRETKTMRLLSSAFAQYEPISDLIIKTSINYQYSNTKFNRITPSTVGATTPSMPSAVIRKSGYNTWLNENTVTYKKSFGDHNFNVLGGMTIQKFMMEMDQITYQGFADDRVPTIAAAQDIVRSAHWLTGATTYNDIQDWSMMSYLARLNYNYKNRYLLSVAVRSDGSSRFGEDNRWGSFPSASIGWIASDEDFMSDFEKLSLLKIRASYGVVGNNNIGNYTQYASVSSGAAANNAIFGNSLYSGAVQTSLPNSGLTWEKTKEYDFGFDAGFFNNRINVTYDYYNRRTSSLLYSVSVAQESGFSSFMANIGELKFWGHEFMINTKNLTGQFEWNTSFNISFTDNEVVSLAGDIDRIYSSLFDANITQVGEKIGLLYGMVWDGVYDDQEEFENSPKAVASEVGTIKYKDIGGGPNGEPDGIITHGGDNDDRTVIGDPTPKFTYGITNNFSYKNVDLSIVMAGAYGHDLIIWSDQSLANLDGNYNLYRDVKDRWRSESNPGAGKYGKTTSGTANERDWPSSRFVDDASYLTIKNLTLGYTVPSKLFSNFRVFMSIQQLYTFSKYRGANPESSNSFYSGNSTGALSLGSDFASYPVPRTISFGLNIGL
nr:TonB-dependent receptor [uncultured Draconibacterium sp.]